jgi:hypothetical protein
MVLTDNLVASADDSTSLITKWIRPPIVAVSFWSAIALPGVYLPLLAIGVETTTEVTVFVGLFVLHVLTLLGGHNYQRSRK